MFIIDKEKREYPPSAYFFRVEVSGLNKKVDCSFKEVSGLSSELEIEEVQEGGENRFSYKLPKQIKYQNLILKRGVGALDSGLVIWCKETLEDGFTSKISPRDIIIHLMTINEETSSIEPIRSWSIVKAYPIKWNVESFDSMKNEIALETIELVYHGLTRVI